MTAKTLSGLERQLREIRLASLLSLLALPDPLSIGLAASTKNTKTAFRPVVKLVEYGGGFHLTTNVFPRCQFNVCSSISR